MDKNISIKQKHIKYYVNNIKPKTKLFVKNEQNVNNSL